MCKIGVGWAPYSLAPHSLGSPQPGSPTAWAPHRGPLSKAVGAGFPTAGGFSTSILHMFYLVFI